MDERKEIIVFVPIAAEQTAIELAHDVLRDAAGRFNPDVFSLFFGVARTKDGKKLFTDIRSEIATAILQVREEAKLRYGNKLDVPIDEQADKTAEDTVRLVQNYASMLDGDMKNGIVPSFEISEDTHALRRAAKILEKRFLGRKIPEYPSD